MQTFPVNMKTFLLCFMLASAPFAFGNDRNSIISTSTSPPTSSSESSVSTAYRSKAVVNTTLTFAKTSSDLNISTSTIASTHPENSSNPDNSSENNNVTNAETSMSSSSSGPITSPFANTSTTFISTTTSNSTAISVSSTPTLVSSTPSSSDILTPSSSVISNTSASTQASPGSSQSPGSTQSSSAIPTLSPPKVQISETNIKMWKGNATSSSWFIELSGPVNQNLTGLILRVQNGAKNNTGTLLTMHLTHKLDANGLYLLNKENLPDVEKELDDVQEILILLYIQDAQTTVLDYLMYATNSDFNFDPALREKYHPADTSELIVSLTSFNTEKAVSLSRCASNHEGFVLAPATQGLPNNCHLDIIQVLQMMMSMPMPNCDAANHPAAKKLKAILISRIVTGVNTRKLCGFTPVMLPNFDVTVRCKDKKIEVPVTFTVHAAFQGQINAIIDGYRIFVQETKTITFDQMTYNVLNCTESCFTNSVHRDTNGGDNKIKVTIAVVVSCIGVFLVILICIIIYMKRKRRGILQFRMTRLDEDDNDLIGDMDDFVGNHGPTFSSFK